MNWGRFFPGGALPAPLERILEDSCTTTVERNQYLYSHDASLPRRRIMALVTPWYCRNPIWHRHGPRWTLPFPTLSNNDYPSTTCHLLRGQTASEPSSEQHRNLTRLAICVGDFGDRVLQSHHHIVWQEEEDAMGGCSRYSSTDLYAIPLLGKQYQILSTYPPHIPTGWRWWCTGNWPT